MQATKKPHNYHKTVVWQKDDRIRKSPLKFYVYYYSELSGDCQVSIFTELWRLSVAFCVTLWHMSIVAGAVCVPAEKASFERMRQAAERFCAAHESEPADAVLLCAEEYRWDDVELGGAEPNKLVSQPLEPTRLMTEEDKDVALDCLRIMLRSENADASIDAVLERLGQYYHADRVYILVLGEQGRTVTMLNEWVEKGKHSIQQNISGKRVSRFPVIARYSDTAVPVVLSMRSRRTSRPRAARSPGNMRFSLWKGSMARPSSCVSRTRAAPCSALRC